MLPVETVELIQRKAVEASKAQVLNVPRDPEHVVRFTTPDGKIVTEEVKPKSRLGTFRDLKSLINFAKNLKEGIHKDGDSPVIWMDKRSILLVLDDVTRRSKIELSLLYTDQFDDVINNAQYERSHKDFLRFLKINLAGALPENSTLVHSLGKLTWKKTEQGESVVSHGSASMGNAINSAIQGLDVLPEEVVLKTRIFDVPDITYEEEITCALDIDEDAKTFRLVPLPGERSRVVDAVCNSIFYELGSELGDIPIYNGSPAC